MRTVVACAWMLAVLLVPSASAAGVEGLAWTSPAPIALGGAVRVEVSGGVAQVDAADAAGASTLELGNGTLVLSSWRRARLDVPPSLGDYGLPMESAKDETFEVRGTRLTLRLDHEPLLLTLATRDGGLLLAEGEAGAPGRPVRLAATFDPYPADSGATAGASPMRPPPLVDWTWEAGWLFCGDYPQAAEGGFPALSRPVLRARGPVDLMVRGGTASFLDANGTLREVRLGDVEEPGSPSAPGVGVRRQTYLYFHGEVHDAAISPSGTWGLAGPEVSWRVEGTLATERATGEYRDERGVHAFADAPLRARGDLALRPDAPSGSAPTARDAYDASGRFDALEVGGARVVQPQAASLAAPAAGATALGVLLLVLTKTGRDLLSRAFAPLYTRLAPGDLLGHETRRRLHAIVSAEPGIHLREVGRRAGLAWGSLRFHVQMLRKAGHLVLHRRGGHVHVYPAGVGPATVSPVLHPIAERILASLPDDGAPLEARALQAQVDASRQLLEYHLRKLAADGRVRLTGSRPRLVARVLPGRAEATGADVDA